MRTRAGAIGWLWIVACRPAAPVPTGAPVVPAVAGPSAVEPATTATDAAGPAPLDLVEVSPGVFAALQPAARRFADSNAVLIVDDVGTMIVDGPSSLAAVRWLRAQAEARTRGPRRVLVTTHWHLDHSLGGTRLRAWWEREGASVEHWGHAGLDALIEGEGEGQLREHRAALPRMLERGEAMRREGRRSDGTALTDDERAQLDHELVAVQAELDATSALVLATPSEHAAGPTRVELGETVVELHPMRAHTDADLVLYLPAAKVLITGDVLDELPFGGHGRPQRWLAELERLRQLDVVTIIPGHGPVMGPEALERAISLWAAILEQAAEAVERGQTAQERYAAWKATPEHERLRSAMVRDAVAERAFEAFVPESLARAMAERRGEI